VGGKEIELLIGLGTGIRWPDIDEDISVPRLLGLPC